MDVLTAVSMLLNLATTLTELTAKLQTIGAVVLKAQSEGRTTLTDDEWQAVMAVDDEARTALQNAIDQRKD